MQSQSTSQEILRVGRASHCCLLKSRMREKETIHFISSSADYGAVILSGAAFTSKPYGLTLFSLGVSKHRYIVLRRVISYLTYIPVCITSFCGLISIHVGGVTRYAACSFIFHLHIQQRTINPTTPALQREPLSFVARLPYPHRLSYFSIRSLDVYQASQTQSCQALLSFGPFPMNHPIKFYSCSLKPAPDQLPYPTGMQYYPLSLYPPIIGGKGGRSKQAGRQGKQADD
ncbi:hypothetical protein BJ878DRAFT_38066 [Calycina marina]|uniref:Uncharacterized protein n=1 Tax=Calycina marina TaxID=1763456 RepID=A0A9P7Z4C6_9HELO|nr:hypothetical protein BJ878DRAFT_38066 [Calycina marina]